MVQSCNHVAAALYRIEAVVKNGWLILLYQHSKSMASKPQEHSTKEN